MVPNFFGHFWPPTTIFNFPLLSTLFVPGQGHNGPGDWNTVCPIHKIRARPIKILDFVPFYVWMVLENSFLEFVFEIFVNLKKEILIEGSPLRKKIEDIQKKNFSQRNQTFSFWICIIHILSFILRYITLVYVKFSNFDHFLLNFLDFLPLYFGFQHGQK